MILSLKDDTWQSLRNAYGNAGDTPKLLEEAKTAPSGGSEAEPWFSLWSSLCHQGDIYSASIAALPHLKQIGKERLENDVTEPLDLLCAICVSALRNGLPEGAKVFAEEFQSIVDDLPGTAVQLLRKIKNDDHARYIAATILISTNHMDIGTKLYDSDEEMECPNCDAIFPRYYDLDDEYSFADE